MKGKVFEIVDEKGNGIIAFWDKESADKVLDIIKKSKPFAWQTSNSFSINEFDFDDTPPDDDDDFDLSDKENSEWIEKHGLGD